MARRWKKYLNSNKTPFDCQLVTAINAYYYLTGKTIPQNSDQYDEFVKIAKCDHGAAIGIEKIWKKLNLKVIKKSRTLLDIQIEGSRLSSKTPLPIEWRIWHKKTGFHSTLIVDECKKTQCFRVTNFKDVTSVRGWIFKEDMYMYSYPLGSKDYVCFKLFGLKK